jgi:hypothetical protein
MRLFVKILIAGLALFLFGCFRKKNAAPSLVGWLEEHFPGRFQVLSTHIQDPIRNFSFQVKNSVVAERSRPLVQAAFRWDKREPGLGMSVGAVDSAFAQAAIELADAQALYSALKNAGFERVSAGIYRGTAQVLIFEEPTPERRRLSLFWVKNALSQWPASANYDLHLAYMEPSEHGLHFQEIAPLDYWETPSGQHRERIVFWQPCSQPYEFDPARLEREWRFSLYSKRFGQCSQQARSRAQDWAAEHLQQPFALLEIAEFEQGEQRTTQVKFKFPYTTKPLKDNDLEPEISGYLTLDYDVDHHVFSPVKNSKD